MTGLAGFVGRHLGPAFAELLPGAEIASLDCDVTDATAVRDRVRAVRPEAALHLAAIAAVVTAQAEPERAWRVNLDGTLNLARALLAEAPACALVFGSSADAYGASFRAGAALGEAAPLAPLNTYGATKAAADLALGAMAASNGLHAIRLRLFNQAGPGQDDAFALAAFARQIALIEAGRQERVLRVGNLEAARDYLDVRDACRAYAMVLAAAPGLPAGAVFNVASGQPRRIGDVLAAMLSLSGMDAAIMPEAARLRPSDIAVAAGDSAAIRARLGWRPTMAWERTLGDVLADWRVRIAS